MKIPRLLVGLAGLALLGAGLPAGASSRSSAAPPNWPVPRYALVPPAAPGEPRLDTEAGAGLDKSLPTPDSSFVGISPCRVVDTRGNGFGGAYGPPLLSAEVARDFVLTGRCGVPTNAVAVSLNFTVVSPTGDGFLATFPAAGVVPLVSTLNFRAGQVLANAALVPLGTGGAITVYASGASTHLLIDVNGYFVPPPSGQKLCIIIKAGDSWIDTLPVPATWTASLCDNHRAQQSVTNSSFQLGCLFETGLSLGTVGGGAPTPNCGW
jgi:hypothetical protein